MYVEEISHHGCSGRSVIWVGKLGGDPPHGADPGGIPPPGGKENYG